MGALPAGRLLSDHFGYRSAGRRAGNYWTEIETEIARAICWRLGVTAEDSAAQALTS